MKKFSICYQLNNDAKSNYTVSVEADNQEEALRIANKNIDEYIRQRNITSFFMRKISVSQFDNQMIKKTLPFLKGV